MKILAPILSLALLGSVASPRLATQDSPPPAGNLVVLGQGDRSIHVIETASGDTRVRHTAEFTPHEAIAAADGKRVFVLLYGDGEHVGHHVVDLELPSGKIGTTWDLGALTRPHGCAVQDGKLWFTSETTRTLGRLDPQTGRVDRVLGHGIATGHMVAIDASGLRGFVVGILDAQLARLDLRSVAHPRAVRITDLPGKHPEGLALAADGSRVYVGNRGDGTVTAVDAETLEVLATAPAGRLPFRLLCPPAGDTVLVCDPAGQQLLLLDPQTLEQQAALDLDGAPAGITLAPGGKHVACSLIDRNQAVVIALESRSVVARYDVGERPDGIAWARSNE